MIKTDKILLVNLGGAGDLILATPALRAVRKARPLAEITLMCAERSAGVVDGLDWFDNVVTVRLGGIFPGLAGKAWGMRTERFDMAVNLMALGSRAGAVKMRLLLMVLGAKVNAGRNTEGRGAFFDIRIDEELDGAEHEIDRNLRLLAGLGIGGDRDPEIAVGKGDEDVARGLLNEAGAGCGKPVVGLNPGAGWESNRWRISGFSEVAARLKRETGCAIVITGTAGESALARDIIRAAGSEDIFDFTGRTSLKQLAALLKGLDLFISNDTGARHVAALVQVPHVVLFGRGNLMRFYPQCPAEKVIVLHKNVDCAPCYLKTCESKKRLEEITADTVVEASLKLLGARK